MSSSRQNPETSSHSMVVVSRSENEADRGTLTGTLAAEQVDAMNQRTPVAGLVSGSVVSAGVATINITLPGGEVRTHFAQWRNDSLLGDWSVQSGGTGGGSFRAGRTTP